MTQKLVKRGFKSYGVWRSMMQRCREKDYPNYGAKGIKVCKRWLRFENFLKDMGERPNGMSIDRLNGNGNYSPSNCRWSTSKQQTRNSQRNIYFKHSGMSMCIMDWCICLNVPWPRVYQRISRGWSIGAALFHPKSIHHPRKGKVINRKRYDPIPQFTTH